MDNIKKHFSLLILILLAFNINVKANPIDDNVIIGASGVVVETKVNSSLENTTITVLDAMMMQPIFTTTSDINGSFYLSLPAATEYLLVAEKDNYFRSKKRLSPNDLTRPITLELEPKPGYFMDVTIFDGQRVDANVNMVEDARVEIYNNTTGEQELTVEKNPKAGFNHSFKEGNHYTMLVRKHGYLNRRVEVYVDVNDCILCIDGMGIDRPDVTDIMLRENQIGYLLGNIAMDTIEIGKTFNLENIYYDFDQSYIRPDAAIELDKLVTFLRDNPAIEVELSAHTDSRGSDSYNMSLSGRRAAAAVQYIINEGKVSNGKINSKGYGETQITNGCSNGVPCSNAQHQDNRRTEITITGYNNSDPLDGATLKEIIEIPDIYERMIEERKQEKKLIKEMKKGV